MVRFFSFYSLIFCFLTACGQSSSSTPSAPSVIHEIISWETYEEMSETQSDLQVVDVRTPKEFGQGNILNALNIDYYRDDFEAQLETLDKTRPIVIYCKSGGRSNKAAIRCKKVGFEKIYDVSGGYDEWKANNKKG